MLESLAIDYTGFDASEYPLDLHGWGSDSTIFADLIERVTPRIIIEVGTWLGASALHMANVCRDMRLTTKIICVDTWLGAYEFIDDRGERDLHKHHGWPMVYFQFLANVIKTGHADRILPFPQTSLIAARYLWHQGIRADLIYIDGSHDAQDVLADIKAYWLLLSDRGVLFGDDYDHWADVRDAVGMCGRPFDLVDNRYWVLR